MEFLNEFVFIHMVTVLSDVNFQTIPRLTTTIVLGILIKYSVFNVEMIHAISLSVNIYQGRYVGEFAQ